MGVPKWLGVLLLVEISSTINHDYFYVVAQCQIDKCRGGVNSDFQGYLLDLAEININETIIDCECATLNGTIPSNIGRFINLQVLKLNRNEFTGTIPLQISELINLKELSLQRNRLRGAISPHILRNMIKLTRLSLYENGFNGTISPQISKLSRLQYLELDGNSLSGSIPSDLGEMNNLYELQLKLNHLNGTIPKELGKLTKLDLLGLDRSGLNGTIPKELGKMKRLRKLFLYENHLSGFVPSQLSELTNLVYFELFDNQLNSTIPTEVGKLNKLYTFLLTRNELKGSIPSQIANMVNLTYLDLSGNDLSSSIPSQLCSMSKLNYLFLYGNRLNGTIHTEFGNMKNLQYLEMRSNQLAGEIPRQIGNMSELVYVQLRSNQLTNTIPKQVSKLNKLTMLNLHTNFINGTIPGEFIKLNNLRGMFLHNNQLNIDEDAAHVVERLTNLAIFFLSNNTNFDTTCDNKLLDWYPDFAGRYIDDRDLIYCAENENIYGELRLNPHVLRIDNEAPKTHPTWRKDYIVKTSRSIHLSWSYGDTELNSSSFSSFIDNFASFNYAGDSAPDVDRKEQLRLFRACEIFIVPFFLPGYVSDLQFFGFELTLNDTRLCVLASETVSSHYDSDFSYNVTGLIPSSGYEFRIRPFYLYFRRSTRLSIYKFGIQSSTLRERTGNDLPTAGPENITLLMRTHNSVTIQWAELPESVSSGQVLSYNVYAVCASNDCPETVHKATVKQATIRPLRSGKSYTFSVSASTSKGEGPQALWRAIETCRPNTRSLKEEGPCEQADPGFFINSVSGLASSCSDYSNEINYTAKACFGNESNRVNIAQDIVLNRGFWRPDVASMEHTTLCPEPNFCISSITSQSNTTLYQDSDVHCNHLHTGVYCSGCRNDYRLSSVGCVACEETEEDVHRGRMIAYIAVIIGLFVLYLLKMLVFSNVVTCPSKGTGCSGKGKKVTDFIKKLNTVFKKHLSTKLKIWFATTQILLLLQRTFSTIYSEVYGTNNSLMTVLSLNLQQLYLQAQVHCFIEVNFYTKLLVMTLLPIFVMLLYCLVYIGISKLFRFTVKAKNEKALYREILDLFYVLAFYVYAPVSQAIIETFLCEEIYFSDYSDTESSFLRADYRLSCTVDTYRGYVIYAVFMIFLYPVGIPIAYGYCLNRRKDLLLQKKVPDENDKKKLASVLFLTRPYRRKAYWFEVYELLRKLSMTSFVAVIASSEAFFGNDIAAETFTFVIGIANVLFLMVVRPYKYRDDFLFSLLSLLLLCVCTQVTALVEFTQKGIPIAERSEYEANIYVGLITFEFALLLMFIAVNLFMSLYKSGESKHSDSNASEEANDAFDTDISLYMSSYNELETYMATYKKETIKLIDKLKLELRDVKGELKKKKQELAKLEQLLDISNTTENITRSTVTENIIAS